MSCVKFDRILKKLVDNYCPFKMLNQDRLDEALNLVRFIELHTGETMQIMGGEERDYIFILEGDMTIAHAGSIKTISDPDLTSTRPILLPLRPTTSTLIANKNSVVCHADRQTLDNLISWSEISGLLNPDDKDFHERINLVRNAQIFQRIPVENLEQAFKCMTIKHVKKGETIINHGQDAAAFYIISEGNAKVWQILPDGVAPEIVARLGVGDAFGHEALISGTQQSEKVEMQDDGILLVLSKERYNELIGKQMLTSVNAQVAKTMIDTDYELLDVRCPEEREDEGYIPNSISIPLHELNNSLNELDHNHKYVVHCYAGRRSSIATLILTQNRFTAVNMDGGIKNWPYKIIEPKECASIYG